MTGPAPCVQCWVTGRCSRGSGFVPLGDKWLNGVKKRPQMVVMVSAWLLWSSAEPSGCRMGQ